jgi:hypothetical protein
VLLFGSGPAAGWGVQQHGEGLGGSIAAALARRTGRATTVEFLMEEQWVDRAPAAAMRAQHLLDYDAVVAIGTYRAAWLEIEDWRRHVDELRDTLLVEAGYGGVIQVLALPWADAVERAPQRWGGALGTSVMALAAVAADSMGEFRQIGYLTLGPPADAAEWIGPAFSRATYAAWGEETAAALEPRLAASPAPPGTADS